MNLRSTLRNVCAILIIGAITVAGVSCGESSLPSSKTARTRAAPAPDLYINLSDDPDAEDTEPFIVINPENSNHIVAAWMKELTTARGPRCWTAASFDGGQTWIRQEVSTPDPARQCFDVSLAFGPNGVLYFLKLSNDVYLHRSTDGGLSWDAPTLVVDRETELLAVDRPWLVVDTSGGPDHGTVHVNTTTLVFNQATPHVYMKRSTDGGATFSALTQLDSLTDSPARPTPFSTLSVGAGGLVAVAWRSYEGTCIACFGAALSTDGGRSFFNTNLPLVQRDSPATEESAPFATVAVDPSRIGTASAVWRDTRFSSDGAVTDIAFSRTTDSGASWSEPSRLNDDPTSNGVFQDRQWLAYAPDGTLIAIWRDRRHGGPGFGVGADLYASWSTDGGATFAPNLRLSPESSDTATSSSKDSFYNVAALDGLAVALWVPFVNGKRDVVLARFRYDKR